MPLVVPDDLLETAGLTPDQARLEIACRLFDAEIIDKFVACRWVGLSRDEFNAALIQRGLPVIRYDVEDLEQDLRTLDKMRAKQPCP